MTRAAERHEAAMTLPQEQRAWAGLLQRDGQPQSVVEHSFPNGWNVQRHETINDIRRVGEMTRNCWQGIGGQYSQNPQQKLKGLSPSYQDDFHALHDEHGIPRAVWNTSGWDGQNGVAEAVTGPRNGPVKAEHWPMIQQWATATGRTVDPNEDPYYDQYT